jgi:hypothetical protein
MKLLSFENARKKKNKKKVFSRSKKKTHKFWPQTLPRRSRDPNWGSQARTTLANFSLRKISDIWANLHITYLLGYFFDYSSG